MLGCKTGQRTMDSDLVWQLWACYNDKQDRLVEVFDNASEALFVCKEMNLAASDFPNPPEYRVCEA